MDAIMRRRQMMMVGEPPAPPVMIPYVRGGGDGSYIDTGITPDPTTKVIVWARNWNPGYSYYNWLFGSRIASKNKAFALALNSSADTGKIAVCYNNTETNLSDKWTLMCHYHKYELGPDGFLVDDTLISSVSGSFSNSYNIHLFGYNNGGTHSDAMNLPRDICACKIYKGGSLVRDYTAVESPSIGLYDAVSETLFTNAGNGSFSYGEFAENAYVPLEYIVDDGRAYFDTGLKATYGRPIVCTFMPTNTTAKWTGILGVRIGTSPVNVCAFGLGSATSGQDNMYLYWRMGTDNSAKEVYRGTSSTKLTNKKVTLVKQSVTAYLLYNNEQKGTKTLSADSGFETTQTMAVGTFKQGADSYNGYIFEGRYYHIGFGKNRNYVPAKSLGRIGMYDTYNDVFYGSISGHGFTAGPTL